MLLFLDHRGDLAPLLFGRIYAGRVVSAGMEKEDAAAGGGFDGIEHAVKVKTLGFGGEVRVCLDRNVDVGEDLVVVRPCRVRDVDCLCGCGGGVVEFCEEEGSQVDCSCS